MQSSFWIALLLFLLVASWFIFVRLYSSSRARESSALKKFEEARRQLQEQIAWIDSAIGLLCGIYELEFEHSRGDVKAPLAKRVVDFACQMMKCPAGSLMLINKESEELRIIASNGISEKSAMALRLKIGEGIAGRVAESGKSAHVDNIDTDARFLKQKGVEYRSKSMIAVPLKVKSQVIGVLNLHAEEPHHSFGEREMQALNLLTHQAAFAIENLELYGNLQEFYLEVVEIFARALELKEHITSNNSSYDKLRSYARAISEKLDLPDSIARHVEFASMMYGIGKIGIDDAILRKPGRLTPEEYAEIKKHPEIGHKIFSQVKFLSPATSMILYHQERWDGKGYPAGLRGEEIPLGARIVSVLNAYHAMTSDRPYRQAMSESEAMNEINKGSGTQFDPKVVEAFLKSVESGK